MMEIITFSPTGASLVKIEENGSMGLAPKMPPLSRHEGHLQDHSRSSPGLASCGQ